MISGHASAHPPQGRGFAVPVPFLQPIGWRPAACRGGACMPLPGAPKAGFPFLSSDP
jgi:hypothetical protein